MDNGILTCMYHTYMCLYIHAYACVYASVCVYCVICMYARMCRYIHTGAHAWVHACMQVEQSRHSRGLSLSLSLSLYECI